VEENFPPPLDNDSIPCYIFLRDFEEKNNLDVFRNIEQIYKSLNLGGENAKKNNNLDVYWVKY
jgi:hypothetical protein